MSDNRSYLTHKIHQWGHEYNSYRKTNGKPGIETTWAYRTASPGKAAKGEWSKKVDDDRADYHRQKAKEAGCLII